jgi:hypothetical protein
MTDANPGEKKKLEPLNRFQINYARELIEKNHPMRVAHISAVWPCLCCLRGRRKTSFKLALKKSLRHKMDLKMPKSELAIEEDPFLLMGFGMNAYFDIMKQLIFMFFWISVFFVPVFYIYSSYDGLKNAPYYPLDMWSLGNMGGSSVQCGSVPQSVAGARLSLTCPTGTFDTTVTQQSDPDSKVLVYGIINDSTDVKTYCSFE